MKLKLIIGLLLTFIANSLSKPVKEGALTTELVSSKESIHPGETIDIALRIKPNEGWHTYWKSPGIVGVPTKIDWTLPEGFKVGEILWPQPQTVKMGPYDAYGYDKEVFLVVPLTSSGSLEPGKKLFVKARVSWMCCSKVCQPGFADLSLELPVSKKNQTIKNTEWSKSIINSRSTFPLVNESWETSAVRNGDDIELTLKKIKGKNPTTPNNPYFFCEDGLIHSDKKQIIKIPSEKLIVLKLHISEFGPKKPTHLKGIFFNKSGLPDNSGAPPIYINVPILGY